MKGRFWKGWPIRAAALSMGVIVCAIGLAAIVAGFGGGRGLDVPRNSDRARVAQADQPGKIVTPAQNEKAQEKKSTPLTPRTMRAPMPTKPERLSAPDSTGETITADLSSRNIPIQSDFSGARLLLFGTVENSRQTAPEAGIYDVVVVLEGPPEKTVVRRKSRVAGIWVNAQSLIFQEVPSYYAIISTRPLEEIGGGRTLDKHEIGFNHVYMEIAPGQGKNPAANKLDDYRQALIRLKQREGLYREDQYGVAFIGRSLFRTNIYLPANVPVGTFRARVLLFRQGKFLSQYTAPLNLERAGLERFAHALAFQHPFLYGVFAVVMAVGAGLAASAAFRKKSGS